MEADFQRYYGLDLRRAIWGTERIGLRRLNVLIAQLPHDARLYRTTDGQQWGINEELAAQTLEVLFMHLQVFVAANSKRRRKPKLERIPRPEYVLSSQTKRRHRPRPATYEEVVAKLGGLNIEVGGPADG